MDNKYQGDGLVVQWTNATGSTVTSGSLVLVGAGGLLGVAVHDIANTAAGSVLLPPGVVVTTPVKGHNGTADAAVVIGAKVYWDGSNAFLDTDSTETLAGFAMGAVSSGATTTVPVLLARA